jgi:hypothetical protein
MNNLYAAIFDRRGVPLWWHKASGHPDNAEVLSDGTLAWAPVDEQTFQVGDYEIRRLSGRLVRTVGAARGLPTDIHELQLLSNGNYLFGAQVTESGVDATPFGGSANASVTGFEIQEVRPSGKLHWRWSSLDHIGLAETPDRWWEMILDRQPYDTQHWNAVEPDGKFLLLSFRHLDAVYQINRQTGNVVWKLGGTTTPESLEVQNDPHGSYPLGAMHDVRRDPNGTITIFDNRTALDQPPRVVRYRIDPQAGTARLVQTISDPDASASICCGSARRLPSGNWLVSWGGIEFVGGYDGRGRRLFKLETPGGFSYRANPVPAGVLSAKRLRHAMNLMSN